MNLSMGIGLGRTNEVQAGEAVINIDLGDGRAHYRLERARRWLRFARGICHSAVRRREESPSRYFKCLHEGLLSLLENV